MNYTRRVFLKSTGIAGACLASARLGHGASTSGAPASEGELLYNGIRLPAAWPPAAPNALSRVPRTPPYLQAPPAIIPIDVGRQLFVDDFLIQKTDLRRQFHYPEKYAGNPVLRPETPLELNQGIRPCAAVFNDGVCFDPRDRLFKLWYHAGWFDGTGFATSRDGLHWERPALDVVPGTNRILPPVTGARRDGCSVWLDPHAQDPAQRFKMFLYERPAETLGGQIFTSPDGIRWSAPRCTGRVGDNTTIFYNPFRRKWVYSIRRSIDGRARFYREHNDLLQGGAMGPGGGGGVGRS